MTEVQPIETPAVDGFDQVVAVVELLAELQRHTFTRLAVPSAEALGRPVLRSWEIAARLLRGEALHRRRMRLHTPAPAGGAMAEVGYVGPLTLTRPLVAQVGTELVQLGGTTETCDAARLVLRTENDDGTVTWDFVAEEGAAFALRLAEATPLAGPAAGPGSGPGQA